jgi:hypothetical protein
LRLWRHPVGVAHTIAQGVWHLLFIRRLLRPVDILVTRIAQHGVVWVVCCPAVSVPLNMMAPPLARWDSHFGIVRTFRFAGQVFA